MNKEEIAPGIVVYSNVISDSENLYKDIEEGMASVGFVWNAAGVKESTDPMVNKKTRDTSTFGIPYKGKIEDILVQSLQDAFINNLNNLFFENFDPIEKDYMATYGIGSDWHDSYGILKYGKGQQFTNHIDDHPSYHRRVSTVYYLNENYTGGEINFPRFDVTLKPKANQMIVFPSTYVYNHSVSPVIEGERYAVVSWLR
ncbi:MAG: 2OG-Fe(II) oxygenase [Thaumarchaeota archaeon]|nr:2OG-Fe(II) oxygenase [Nitrososphaerota archaeon]